MCSKIYVRLLLYIMFWPILLYFLDSYVLTSYQNWRWLHQIAAGAGESSSSSSYEDKYVYR